MKFLSEKRCKGMGNFILFLNTFFSYLLLFAIIVVLVVGAVFAGVRLRKNKMRKDALLEKNGDVAQVK